MKRFGTIGLLIVGFITGIFFVYSCGGGGSATGGGSSWPAPVAATGQITSYAGTDDGALQMGVAWPSPRLTDNADGTITDNLTGLIWLKNANCFGQNTWTNALAESNNLANGSCGLTDGSTAGDWRLPNVKELMSLVDYRLYSPALPSGHPFVGVQSFTYFTSTTYTNITNSAWTVNFLYGVTFGDSKGLTFYVWPVRGGV